MSRHTRAFFIIPILLYLRLFVPLVQCEISPPDWNSRGDADGAYREAINGKASLPNLPNRKEDSALWASLTDSSGSAKDLADSASAGYPFEQQSYPPESLTSLMMRSQNRPIQFNSGRNDARWLQPLALARKLQQQEQLGLLESDLAAIDNPFEDFAQPSYPASLSDNYVQSLGSQAKPRVRPIRPLGNSRFLSNLKRARDGYMCHFKLCQVGVSGKRLSM